jgi:hypothetical protein
MSSLFDRRIEINNARLSIVQRAASNLITNLSELNALLDQISKAEQTPVPRTRRSPNRRKRVRN